MPARFTDWPTLLLVLCLLVTGSLGGCAAASHRLLGNRRVTAALAVAYGIIGALFGLLTYVVNDFFLMPAADLPALLTYSAVMGFGGATVMASTNILLSIALPKLGIRVDIRIDRSRRGGDK